MGLTWQEETRKLGGRPGWKSTKITAELFNRLFQYRTDTDNRNAVDPGLVESKAEIALLSAY
jgi:hypothetical protein